MAGTAREFSVDKLKVKRYETRQAMGESAARDAIACIAALLKGRNSLRIIFAAAPSQNEFLSALSVSGEVPWERIEAFHMDEYIGLAADAPQGFGNFLKRNIFGIVPFKSVAYIDGNADPQKECARYASLIEKAPVDIVFCGIGENGHLAFNDPPVADFNDPELVKVVPLDETCRMQQVHDGCFAALAEVPTHAITITIPALMGAAHIFCVVPAKTKAEAVYALINDPITTACPATALRRHPNAILYIDGDSASLLK